MLGRPFLVLFVLLGHATLAAEKSSFHAAFESITSQELQQHVDTLADDIFEGREAGSRGGRAAAMYLRQALDELGLAGAGDDGDTFQSFRDGYRNLLVRLPGRGDALSDEVILIGAHYDHVGYGSSRNSYGPTGYIHNGADDNASGASALLELAQAFSQLNSPPQRTLLFALWDGEEKGLLGSTHWLNHPTIPHERLKLAINMDMVGRLKNGRLEVGGTRTSWGLRRAFSRVAQDSSLWIDFAWELQSNSDHWPFFQRGLPTIMLHTGIHNDYHRPSDDAHLINADGMREVVQLLFEAVYGLGEAAELAGFRAESKSENERGRRRLERPLAALPPRLGVIWDDETTPGKVTVKRILQGSAAHRAQLQVGDRIVRADSQSIETGDELRSAVLTSQGHLSLGIERDGEKEAIDVPVAMEGTPVHVGISWREDNAEPGNLLLTRVVPGSSAAQAGLAVNDRIYQFEGNDFHNGDEFRQRIVGVSGFVSLLVESRGMVRTVQLELPKVRRSAHED